MTIKYTTVLAAAVLACSAHAGQAVDAANKSQHDFDFFVGDWVVVNKKLTHPLSHATEWESFTASQHVKQLPGGIGNFDDFVAPTWRPGYVGMSLRIFNPTTHLWSIYWLSNRDGGIDASSGALLPPVVGAFKDGVGKFEARDTFQGKPILVRYLWSGIRADSAHWEQAYSDDDGKTWETNWIMELSRTGK